MTSGCGIDRGTKIGFFCVKPAQAPSSAGFFVSALAMVADRNAMDDRTRRPWQYPMSTDPDMGKPKAARDGLRVMSMLAGLLSGSPRHYPPVSNPRTLFTSADVLVRRLYANGVHTE